MQIINHDPPREPCLGQNHMPRVGAYRRTRYNNSMPPRGLMLALVRRLACLWPWTCWVLARATAWTSSLGKKERTSQHGARSEMVRIHLTSPSLELSNPILSMRAGNGTSEDFDELFRGYTAALSYPAAMYPEELYAAYPHAKFILVRAVLRPFSPTHTFPVVLTCTADNA